MRNFVFWFLLIYGIERLVETFWKRRKLTGKVVEYYTFPLLVGSHILIYAVTLRDSLVAEAFPIVVTFAGIVAVLISSVSRNWTIRTLGLYHSVYIEIRDVHPLIQGGPYRYVRNPYYLSNLLEIVGLPLVAGSSWGLLLSVLMYAPILVLRLMLEEQALSERLGNAFVKYKERVPRLIPKLL